ncbi:hypothetical protein FXN63_05490 [Pigmentiphaga aceris]|uniref:Uncharacterized protein n=1 Tax=Pigmentiphaga aceris TaxID=1940612 RepID=A0A5C0ATC1_9BURK|nr:hypothetical protein [Pigmentiphaga aceris]QEI05355.1 hypothetical protein FXN63_05490 [Pigmentiphaga aceris]
MVLPTPLLDRLWADAVILPAHHEAAIARLQGSGAGSEPYANLGEALFWLLEQGILSNGDIEVMGNLAQPQAAFPTNATRRQALVEFDSMLQRLATSYDKAHRRAFWQAVLPGPKWLWAVLGVAIVAGGLWYVLPPSQPPACNDAAVAKQLKVGLFQATIRQQTANPLLSAQTPAPNMLLAELRDVRELGYIVAERARACEASVQMGSQSRSMAYVVSLTESGATQLSAGDDRLTRARFGLVKDGKLPELGMPIGQADLQRALSDGVKKIQAQAGLRGPRSAARVQEREGQHKNAQNAGERADTVIQVLPLGNCEAGQGGHYRCPVMMQYRDHLLAAIGRSERQILEGDFDFVREGDAWRVADVFPQQYRDATMRGRVGEIAGDEAAEKLKQIQDRRTTP